MILNQAQLIKLQKIEDARGNLSFIEENNHIPFKIKRSYWIYDVPGGESRGGHAYRVNQELIVALSGSFDVVIDNGQSKEIFQLNRSYNGLYIPKMLWRELENFSTNSLAFILSSTFYDEKDYIREYDQFKKELGL
jgi:dTDP-4-dehydrorhamnose 3,5-epimerase-like enzyme